MNVEFAQRIEHTLGVGGELFVKRLGRWLVGNSEATSGVDVFNVVSRDAWFSDEVRDGAERLVEGSERSDLRADVDADSGDAEIGVPGGLGVEAMRLGNRHSEFVLVQAGRDIRMRFRRDIGIDAQGD